MGGGGVTGLRAHSRREDKPGWARFSDQFWNHTQTLSPALHRPRQSCLLHQRGQPWLPTEPTVGAALRSSPGMCPASLCQVLCWALWAARTDGAPLSEPSQ